jgi:hypothetical protein
LPTVLTIVPDSEFSASLQFALEAEGYTVVPRADFGDPRGLPKAFDCCVLDHHAAVGHLPTAMSFVDEAFPVVLLANAETHPLAAHSFRTVTKPFLGPLLSDAISAALHRTPTA